MNVVMTATSSKETYIQFRVKEDFKEEVQITAQARGLTVSSLINLLLKQAVRQEKEQYPHLFDTEPKHKAPVVAHIGRGKPTKEEIRRQVIGDDIDDLGTIDYTDAVSRQAERVRLNLLKSDVSPDDPEGFQRAYRDATEEAGKRIAKKRKAKS